jgi:uncharacterized protein YkwD
MRTAPAVPPLEVKEELYKVARDHCLDIGKNGLVSHVSSSGVEMIDRFKKRGTPINCIAENIVFHHTDPLAVVLWQIVDDG